MNRPQVKITLEGGRLPEYKNPGDAGCDVRVIPNPDTLDGSYEIGAGLTEMISLGFRVAIPDGWEMQVRSRSGLSKKGLVVANSPGTIDSGWRGICKVLLHNNGRQQGFFPIKIKAWDRVAQFVLKKAPQAEFVQVESLDYTVRGDGGFGSTGTH